MTTSFLPCACAVVACANTVRVRKLGTAEAPTTAIAPFFMNIRRVKAIETAPEKLLTLANSVQRVKLLCYSHIQSVPNSVQAIYTQPPSPALTQMNKK
jgi:hypothetical protein